MTPIEGRKAGGPSLADRLAERLRRPRIAWPTTYKPALAVAAAAPGITALLGFTLAANEARREAAFVHANAPRIALIAAAHASARRRAEAAPFLAMPTLTASLDAVTRMLPADAVLHAIARGADGVARIEVDCADPDALLSAIRSASPGLDWRSVGQTVVEGSGVRVTLEASR